jgi:hypothetical protein
MTAILAERYSGHKPQGRPAMLSCSLLLPERLRPRWLSSPARRNRSASGTAASRFAVFLDHGVTGLILRW